MRQSQVLNSLHIGIELFLNIFIQRLHLQEARQYPNHQAPHCHMSYQAPVSGWVASLGIQLLFPINLRQNCKQIVSTILYTIQKIIIIIMFLFQKDFFDSEYWCVSNEACINMSKAVKLNRFLHSIQPISRKNRFIHKFNSAFSPGSYF